MENKRIVKANKEIDRKFYGDNENRLVEDLYNLGDSSPNFLIEEDLDQLEEPNSTK